MKKVACLGAGVIGASWAACFAKNGCEVALYDIKEEFLARAVANIRRDLSFLAEKGYMEPAAVAEALGRVRCTTSIEDAVRDVCFMQESGPENYEVKHQILAEVDRYAPADAVYACSTSGLLISGIAEGSAHPERVIGAHPYNPPLLIPLVELAKGEKTSDETVAAALRFYRGMGKEPVVLNKESKGFIANRLQIALARESIDLVVRGVCSLEDVDKAICYGPGLRWAIMGPNLINQLAGGEGGFTHAQQNMSKSCESWLEDLATWTKFPENWIEMGQQGVNEEMAHRRPEEGRTNEEIIRYRDDVLLGILRLVGKL